MAPAWRKSEIFFLPYVLDLIKLIFLPRFQFEGKTDVWISQVRRVKGHRVIFDQWPKLHLGLDALSNQKILKGIYYTYREGLYRPTLYRTGIRVMLNSKLEGQELRVDQILS